MLELSEDRKKNFVAEELKFFANKEETFCS
jgi:hypothetical protein